jgi:hypothetical protein
LQFARGFDVLHEIAAGAAAAQRPPAIERARLQALQFAGTERLLDAAFCWRIVPLDAPAAPLLHAGGERLHAPALLPESGELTAIACCACTLGPRLARRIGELYADGRIALATTLEDLATELLGAVVRRVHDRVHVHAQRQGLSVAGELRSGVPEFDAPAQAAVLRLAHAQCIGVQVDDAATVFPPHSLALVLGVGVELPPDWSRCDACPKCRTCRIVARLRARRVPA